MTLAAKLTDKQKWQRLLSSLRYSLYVIFHPFDGFQRNILHHGRGI